MGTLLEKYEEKRKSEWKIKARFHALFHSQFHSHKFQWMMERNGPREFSALRTTITYFSAWLNRLLFAYNKNIFNQRINYTDFSAFSSSSTFLPKKKKREKFLFFSIFRGQRIGIFLMSECELLKLQNTIPWKNILSGKNKIGIRKYFCDMNISLIIFPSHFIHSITLLFDQRNVRYTHSSIDSTSISSDCNSRTSLIICNSICSIINPLMGKEIFIFSFSQFLQYFFLKSPSQQKKRKIPLFFGVGEIPPSKAQRTEKILRKN